MRPARSVRKMVRIPELESGRPFDHEPLRLARLPNFAISAYNLDYLSGAPRATRTLTSV